MELKKMLMLIEEEILSISSKEKNSFEEAFGPTIGKQKFEDVNNLYANHVHFRVHGEMKVDDRKVKKSLLVIANDYKKQYFTLLERYFGSEKSISHKENFERMAELNTERYILTGNNKKKKKKVVESEGIFAREK